MYDNLRGEGERGKCWRIDGVQAGNSCIPPVHLNAVFVTGQVWDAERERSEQNEQSELSSDPGMTDWVSVPPPASPGAESAAATHWLSFLNHNE